MEAYLVPGPAVCAAYATLAREHNAAPIGSDERRRVWNEAQGFLLALKTLYSDAPMYVGHLLTETDKAIMREVGEDAEMRGGFLLDRVVSVDTAVLQLRISDIVESEMEPQEHWVVGLDAADPVAEMRERLSESFEDTRLQEPPRKVRADLEPDESYRNRLIAASKEYAAQTLPSTIAVALLYGHGSDLDDIGRQMGVERAPF
jgi:hypothetical protein